MVSGGKPLWYLELLTTFSIFFLTVFFAATLASWSSGISEILENPNDHLTTFFAPEKEHDIVKNLAYMKHTITGATFFFNLGMGSVAAVAGTIFGYLLYKEKVKPFYGMVWFVVVCCFTLVWMVTSVIFYVDLEKVAARITPVKDYQDDLTSPLSTMREWGKLNKTSTVLGLIVGPTAGFLFLCFVAYRLNSKLEVFGNLNPDNIVADETHPGSWFERKTGAEGGTWQREAPPQIVEGEPLMPEEKAASGLFKKVEAATEQSKNAQMMDDDVLTTDASPTSDQMVTKEEQQAGWGNWLEDVFDYTF